jgi:hypothetical protein
MDCLVTKPLSAEHFYRKGKHWHIRCIECHKAYGRRRHAAAKDADNETSKRWYAVNRAVHKNAQLRLKYGVTLEQYMARYEAQRGLCAICLAPGAAQAAGTNRGTLVVDHCHKTKRFRGLLCQMCNRGLGHFHDDTDKMLCAISYLERNA